VRGAKKKGLFVRGHGEKLQWTYVFHGGAETEAQFNIQAQTADPLVWTMRLMIPSLEDASSRLEAYWIQAEMDAIGDSERVWRFVSQDPLHEREFLDKAYVIQAVTDGFKPIRKQRAHLIFEDYAITLTQRHSKNSHDIILTAWSCKKNLSDKLPFKQIWTMSDISGDHKIDRIEIERFYEEHIYRHKDLYVGPHYLKKIFQKYKILLQDYRYKKIAEEEIGLVVFSGRPNDLRWEQLDHPNLKGFVQWSHSLLKHQELSLVDYIGAQESFVLSVLRGECGV
jgi:hypothetical protein